jgi:hypothetical protein
MQRTRLRSWNAGTRLPLGVHELAGVSPRNVWRQVWRTGRASFWTRRRRTARHLRRMLVCQRAGRRCHRHLRVPLGRTRCRVSFHDMRHQVPRVLPSEKDPRVLLVRGLSTPSLTEHLTSQRHQPGRPRRRPSCPILTPRALHRHWRGARFQRTTPQSSLCRERSRDGTNLRQA